MLSQKSCLKNVVSKVVDDDEGEDESQDKSTEVVDQDATESEDDATSVPATQWPKKKRSELRSILWV